MNPISGAWIPFLLPSFRMFPCFVGKKGIRHVRATFFLIFMVWKDRNPATRFNLIHYTSCKCLFCLLKLFKQPSRIIHLCSKRQCVSVGKVNLQEIHKTSAFKHGFSCCLSLSLSNKQRLCPGFQKSLRGHTVAAFAGSFWGAKICGCDMGGNIPQRTFEPWKIFG